MHTLECWHVLKLFNESIDLPHDCKIPLNLLHAHRCNIIAACMNTNACIYICIYVLYVFKATFHGELHYLHCCIMLRISSYMSLSSSQHFLCIEIDAKYTFLELIFNYFSIGLNLQNRPYWHVQ